MRRQPLLLIEPHDLTFLVEQGKPTSCTIRVINNSREHVAFKVMTSDPNRFRATAPRSIITPGSSCEVRVTMLGQVEAPPRVRQRDIFRIESLTVNPDDPPESIQTWFNQQRDMVDVCKLRVAYIFPLPQQDINVDYIEDTNGWHGGNLLKKGIIVLLSCLICCADSVPHMVCDGDVGAECDQEDGLRICKRLDTKDSSSLHVYLFYFIWK